MRRVILTVIDHERNGFVHLARTPPMAEDAALAMLHAVDAEVTDDAEPDMATGPFTFILDLEDATNGDLIDNGKRLLPTQLAMRLARDEVQRWLSERPDPDEVIGRMVPSTLVGS